MVDHETSERYPSQQIRVRFGSRVDLDGKTPNGTGRNKAEGWVKRRKDNAPLQAVAKRLPFRFILCPKFVGLLVLPGGLVARTGARRPGRLVRSFVSCPQIIFPVVVGCVGSFARALVSSYWVIDEELGGARERAGGY